MMPLITGIQLTLCRDAIDGDRPDHMHFELPVWADSKYGEEAGVWIALGKWYPATDEWIVNVEDTAKMNEEHQIQLAMATFKQTLKDLGVQGEVVAIDTNNPDVMRQIQERIKSKALAAKKPKEDDDDDALPGQYL